MKRNSKIILCCVLVAAIVIAGYVNFKVNNEGAYEAFNENAQTEESVQEAEAANIDVAQVFSQYRSEREDTRNQEVAYLDSVINSGEVDEQIAKEAMNQKIALTQAMETELILEGLIKSSGHSDAIVTCGNENISVVLADKSISDEQAVRILEIIKSETGKTAQNIKIIPQG